jgi:hypothetical protein
LDVNVFSGIPCGQNDCPAIFFNYRNLRRHLSTTHASLLSSNVYGSATCAAVNKMHKMHSESMVHETGSDVDESVNELPAIELEACSVIDFTGAVQTTFLSFITKLQSRSNVLIRDAKFVGDALQELLGDISSFTVDKVKSVLAELKVDETTENVQALYADLAGIATSVDAVNTEHKQLRLLQKHGFYISPQTGYVSMRTEKRQSSLGLREFKNVCDTFQYIPLEQLLARIVIECRNIGMPLNPDGYKSCDGNIVDWYDTSSYKTHPFFSRFPEALILN